MSDAQTVRVHIHIVTAGGASVLLTELTVDPAITLHELLRQLLRQGNVTPGAEWVFSVGTRVLQLTDTIREVVTQSGPAATPKGVLELSLESKDTLIKELSWLANDLREQLPEKDAQINELNAHLGAIEEQIALGDLAPPPPVPKTRPELEEWGDELGKESAKLTQDKKRLEEERRQFREDEEALEKLMSDLEVSMALEREMITRQETELKRLSAEIQHELEILQRGDAGLREQLAEKDTQINELNAHLGAIEEQIAKGELAPPPPVPKNRSELLAKFQRRAQEVMTKPGGMTPPADDATDLEADPDNGTPVVPEDPQEPQTVPAGGPEPQLHPDSAASSIPRKMKKADGNARKSENAAKLTERRATVRYYTRMNPDCMFPLLVILSAKQVQEIVKATVKQAVSETFKVEEGSTVEIEPVLPGCDCFPPRHMLAVESKEAVTETFWIVPRVLGRVHGARVLIRQGDRVLADVPLDVKVAKQTLAVACGLLSLASPYLTTSLKSLKLDYESQKTDGFPLYQQAANSVAENVRPEWLGLGFLGLAFVLYLWMRPRRRDVFWDVNVK